MPIAALSEENARAITSTLALNDSVSVVKELVDNALDSHATNVVIEISANTLDIIQVKDNGTGIGVEDRQLLCRRGYTSKIRSLDDLAQLGGTFLGFRGEALASLAELSESIAVTTRVDGEAVGTQLRYGSTGKLASSSSASHGTGTTLRVIDFLKSVPVRRQTALKQAPKTLNDIKRLLFAYAFARPTVRFQVKVLKSKSDLKDNWLYAPCKDASDLGLLASKIVGKDIAKHCKQENINSADGGYKIDALLLAPDSEISKLRQRDQFVSIDGRPLTAERGFMKDINKIYRAFLRNHISHTNTTSQKLFLLLHLTCPRGTYDVNIEPAKNEVMFDNLGTILQLFEGLCKKVYGVQRSEEAGDFGSSKATTVADTAQNFDLLLAKKSSLPKPPEEQCMNTDSMQAQMEPPTEQPTCTSAHRNIYDVRDGLQGISERSSYPDKQEGGLGLKTSPLDPRVFNPFVQAKLNSRIGSKNASNKVQQSNTGNSPDCEEANAFVGRVTRRAPMPPLPQQQMLLPSPDTSSDIERSCQNPGPPTRPWKQLSTANRNGEDPATSIPSPSPTLRIRGPTLLDSWASSINSSPTLNASDSNKIKRSESNSSSPPCPTAPGDAAVAQPSYCYPTQRGLGPGQQGPFRSPFKRNLGNTKSNSVEHVQANLTPDLSEAEPPTSPTAMSSTERRSYPGFQQPAVLAPSELDDIMEFELRKRFHILQHRNSTKRPSKAAKQFPDNVNHDQSYLPAQIPSDRPINETTTKRNTHYASKYSSDTQPQTHVSTVQPSSASDTQDACSKRYRRALQNSTECTQDDVRMVTTTSRDNFTMVGSDAEAEAEGEKPSAKKGGLRSRLSPHDRRAYLIRQKDDPNEKDSSAKIGKVKLSKLPFESTHPSEFTYGVFAILDDSSGIAVAQLAQTARLMKLIDPYMQSGTVVPALSDNIVNASISKSWKQKIRDMVDEKGLSCDEQLHDGYSARY